MGEPITPSRSLVEASQQPVATNQSAGDDKPVMLHVASQRTSRGKSSSSSATAASSPLPSSLYFGADEDQEEGCRPPELTASARPGGEPHRSHSHRWRRRRRRRRQGSAAAGCSLCWQEGRRRSRSSLLSSAPDPPIGRPGRRPSSAATQHTERTPPDINHQLPHTNHAAIVVRVLI